MSGLGEDEPQGDEPAEVASLDDRMAKRRAQAYYLRFVQHQEYHYIAETMKCSISTAWRLAQAGQAQAKFLQSTDDQVRAALADGAGWLVAALASERETIGGRMLDYAPVILKALKFEAEVRGSLAAQAGASGQGGPAPDPRTVAALQALYERNGGS